MHVRKWVCIYCICCIWFVVVFPSFGCDSHKSMWHCVSHCANPPMSNVRQSVIAGTASAHHHRVHVLSMCYASWCVTCTTLLATQLVQCSCTLVLSLYIISMLGHCWSWQDQSRFSAPHYLEACMQASL